MKMLMKLSIAALVIREYQAKVSADKANIDRLNALEAFSGENQNRGLLK
jgi:hypothetical protein